MNKVVILGLYITNRVKEALKVQEVLTKFGCSIKTRLGIHDAKDDDCSSNGIIILELCGDEDEMVKLEIELMKIEGLEVKKMAF